MSLDILLAAIRETGQATIQELDRRANAQAQEILASARLEAQSIREQACAAALEPATLERARLIQIARLDALQSVGEVRESLVDTALEECRGWLAALRMDPLYPEVLRKLLWETRVEMESCLEESENGRKACLEVDPRDRAVIEGLIAELEANLAVNYTLSCWGGLVATSEDGSVTVINTLESRLEKATPFLRRSLAALFENSCQEKDESRMMEGIYV
jgi:vacuolar-type H+-ATPase subunit E/Vma4